MISGLRFCIGEAPASPGPAMTSAQVVAAHMSWQASRDREIMTVLLLNGKNHVIDYATISVGDGTSAAVYPAEVFRPAIIARSSAIILVHNHPSGDPEPSACDKDITRACVEAGRLLGIKVLDHVILGRPGHYSFAESGYIDTYELGSQFR